MNQNKPTSQPLPSNAQSRKERPMFRGLLAYFPDALAEIANVSHVGNQQHNPGEEMHWAREKSKDHADCIVRHLLEQGITDTDGLRHSAKMAWRALALLQIEIENTHEPTHATVSVDPSIPTQTNENPEPVSYPSLRQVYIAGPMRGLPELNFPAFDEARDLANVSGWDAISPADIDRKSGIHENADLADITGVAASRTFAERDCGVIIGLKAERGDAIALLPGWARSTGARAEFFLANWVGLRVLDARTMKPFTVQDQKELWDNLGGTGLGELKAAGLRILGEGESE